MDFGSLLHVAQANEHKAKQQSKKCYSTTFSAPKKEHKEGGKSLSVNIQKFLARREEEEKKKEQEAKKKRDDLLALRSQDGKAKKRVAAMLKRTKAANKSAIEDAIDDDNTAVTLTGPSQPDEDDYGYVSQEASAYYNKLMDKYNSAPVEEPLYSQKKKKLAYRDLNSTKDRVRMALLKEEEEEMMPHKRRRRIKNKKEVDTGDTTVDYHSSDLRDLGQEHDSDADQEPEKQPEFIKPKAKKPPAPPIMNFHDLLKLAEKKQFEPIKIEPKKKPEDEEHRPMTKKQKAEYMKELEWRQRKEEAAKGGQASNNPNQPPRIPKINRKEDSAQNQRPVAADRGQERPSSGQPMRIPKVSNAKREEEGSYPRGEERPSRSYSRDEERASKSYPREEERPSRPYPRDEERPSRPYPRVEGKPSRPYSREEERSSRPYSRDEERPSRPYPRDEERPSRPYPRDEERPSRPYPRDEERPSRPYPRDEERPSRPYPRDEERPSRPYSRDEEKPSRPYPREEEKPTRPYPRVEERSSRPYSRDEERPSRQYSRDEERLSRPNSREEERPSRPYPREEERSSSSFRNESPYGMKRENLGLPRQNGNLSRENSYTAQSKANIPTRNDDKVLKKIPKDSEFVSKKQKSDTDGNSIRKSQVLEDGDRRKSFGNDYPNSSSNGMKRLPVKPLEGKQNKDNVNIIKSSLNSGYDKKLQDAITAKMQEYQKKKKAEETASAKSTGRPESGRDPPPKVAKDVERNSQGVKTSGKLPSRPDRPIEQRLNLVNQKSGNVSTNRPSEIRSSAVPSTKPRILPSDGKSKAVPSPLSSSSSSSPSNTRPLSSSDIKTKSNSQTSGLGKPISASESKLMPPPQVRPKVPPPGARPKQVMSSDPRQKQLSPSDVKPRQFPPPDMKPKQFPPADVKPRQFPPPDVQRKQFPPADVRRNPKPPAKRRVIDSEDEYDPEMDDFIDDGPEEEEDYSKHIREIFGYDRRKYSRIEDDDEDECMESNFATILKEDYISTKTGILEDLEDIRREKEMERRKKLAKKKK